jgi:hypothetical protein
MPKIQVYEQQTSPSGLGPNVRASGERITSPIGDTFGQLQSGINQVADGIRLGQRADAFEAKVLKKQEENDAVAWSGKVLSDAHIQWNDEYLKAQENAKPGGAGFTPEFLTKFDKYSEETVKNAPTDASKKYLTDRLTSMRTTLAGQALTFEAQARRDYRMDQSNTMIENNAKTVQDNPGNFTTLYAESLASIEALELPPKEKSALREKLKSTLPYAAVYGQVKVDPEGVARRLRGSVPKPTTDATGAPAASGSSFDTVMGFIFKKEGGYNANDGNGPVNFGINQAANPDIDVKSLTKDGAKTLYQKRYWDKIGGDNLSPGVALMAMDAAVNQGVPFAKRILAESGGDINKMAALRAEHYRSLVENEPARYGRYAKVWASRLADATAQANAAGGGAGVGNLDVANVTPVDVKPTGDSAIDALSFNQRIQLLQQADTLVNQQMALAREQLKSKVQDFSAMAQSGVAIPANAVPSVQELTAAHGEADGLRIYNDEVKPMLELNGDLQRFSTMSVGERQRVITERAPVPGDGYADATKRHAIMIQADQQLRTQMAADPAAYAMKYSPTVAQSFANLQQVPAEDMLAKSAAASAFVTATLAEQNRLGVLNPTVLPKTVADGIVRQFFDQKDGGQNAAVLMQQQAQLWGKHWPAVYGQMAKDLPGAALVIGSGMKQQPAELLARANAMKPDELKAGLVSDDIKTAKEKLQGTMADFQRSLAPMAGGAQTFSTFNEQTEKLTLMYMQAGETPQKAAVKAFNDTVGEKYEFVNNTNNTAVYRIPKGYDPSSITRGARRSIGSIGDADLEVPVSLNGLNAGQAKEAYVSAIKSSGYWVTAPDESGLVLYANGAAVVDTKGKPILRQWDELQVSTPGQFQSGKIRRAP